MEFSKIWKTSALNLVISATNCFLNWFYTKLVMYSRKLNLKIKLSQLTLKFLWLIDKQTEFTLGLIRLRVGTGLFHELGSLRSCILLQRLSLLSVDILFHSLLLVMVGVAESLILSMMLLMLIWNLALRMSQTSPWIRMYIIITQRIRLIMMGSLTSLDIVH